MCPSLVFLLSFLLALTATAQRIFINQVPEYSQLPLCAEAPLSNIVRNMVSGCGDGGRTTSYNCFCTSSSTKFESIISRVVASKCMPAEPEATASALAVFDSYCHLSPQAAPALATQTATASLQMRPSFSSESTTALELSTSLLTAAVVDTNSALVTDESAQVTADGTTSSAQRSPPGLSSTPTRTQLTPIPSESLSLSGASGRSSEWLPFCVALWGLKVIISG